MRPEWTAMTIIYWSVRMPWRIGVGVAWLAGLALDGIQGVTLGKNAIGLVAIAYVCHMMHQRMRNFALLQQAAVVFVLVGVHLLLGHWVQSLAQGQAGHLNFLLSALTSALCWPFFALIIGACFSAPVRASRV